MDRFDLRLRVEPTDGAQLLGSPPGESTADVLVRVAQARARAGERGVTANRLLSARTLDSLARLDDGAKRLLGESIAVGRLTGRGLRRVKCVALTLDDLRGGDGCLDSEVVAQAMALRADLRFGEVGAGTW